MNVISVNAHDMYPYGEFVYSKRITDFLNKNVFNGLLKKVYIPLNPNIDKFEEGNVGDGFYFYLTASEKEQLNLDGSDIVLVFINDAVVLFSNTEYGDLERVKITKETDGKSE